MLCMKVLPVYLNFTNHPAVYNTPARKNIAAANDSTNTTILPAFYYQPVSFSGKEEKKEALVNDLKALKNLHCPYCGTKMFSSDEFQAAQDNVEKITTVNDLFKYLDKYEEYINPRFKNIVAEVKRAGYANYSRTPDDVLTVCKTNMQQKTEAVYKSMLVNLDDIINNGNLDEHDKTILSDFRDEAATINDYVPKRVGIYREFSKTLKNSVSEMYSREKNQIYQRLNSPVRDAFVDENLFSQPYGEETSLTKIFLRNLLRYSRSDIHNVSEKAPDGIDNIMLSCKHCYVTGKGLHSKDLKRQNYYNHIYELCGAALAGDLHENRSYPILLQNNVIKNYNNRFVPDNFQPDLRALLKTTGIKPPKYVTFPLTDVPGICCASCGQKTITHDQKAKIFTEINDAETMPDLLGVLHKYHDVIKPKYNILIQEFENNLHRHSFDTESNMVKLLKVFVYKNLQDTLTENMRKVEDITDNYNLQPSESAAVRKFISKANAISLNMNPDTVFPLDDYHDILSELVGKLSRNARREIWEACYQNIVEDYSRQIVLIPPESLSYKGKSDLKVMAEYIFTHSQATVDHLDPKYKYNAERKNNNRKGFPENKNQNLVVMCKDCNNSKSSTELRRWVQKHPEMIRNMEKYIMQVKQLRKDRIIGQKFEFYPYEVAAQFTRLTGIDLSTTGSK